MCAGPIAKCMPSSCAFVVGQAIHLAVALPCCLRMPTASNSCKHLPPHECKCLQGCSRGHCTKHNDNELNPHIAAAAQALPNVWANVWGQLLAGMDCLAGRRCLLELQSVMHFQIVASQSLAPNWSGAKARLVQVRQQRGPCNTVTKCLNKPQLEGQAGSYTSSWLGNSSGSRPFPRTYKH